MNASAETTNRSILLAAAAVGGAGLKVVYDLLLWVSFRRLRPPEEESS